MCRRRTLMPMSKRQMTRTEYTLFKYATRGLDVRIQSSLGLAPAFKYRRIIRRLFFVLTGLQLFTQTRYFVRANTIDHFVERSYIPRLRNSSALDHLGLTSECTFNPNNQQELSLFGLKRRTKNCLMGISEDDVKHYGVQERSLQWRSRRWEGERHTENIFHIVLRGLPTLDAKKGYYFINFFDRFIL